jgi:hypothetical protein
MINVDVLLTIKNNFQFKMLTIFTWNLTSILLNSDLSDLKGIIKEIDIIIERAFNEQT